MVNDLKKLDHLYDDLTADAPLKVYDDIDGSMEAFKFICLYRYLGCNTICEHVEVSVSHLIRIRIVPASYLGTVDRELIKSDEICRYRNLGEIKEPIIFKSFGLSFKQLAFKKARGRIYEHMLELVFFDVKGGEMVFEREQLQDSPRYELRIESLVT